MANTEKIDLGRQRREARAAAEAERRARPKRTPQEQIAFLDFNLGKGVGAVRERARLNAKIVAMRPTLVQVAKAEAEATKPSKGKPKKLQRA